MKYVIDLDGTLWHSELQEDGTYEILVYSNELIMKINELHKAGHTIILWTARHWDKLEATKKQVDSVGIKYTTLTMSKPNADVFIDDRSMTPKQFLWEVENNKDDNVG